jgi:hypothetical protein
MCESKYPTQVAFTYLEALRKDFMSRYTQLDIDKATPYSFNDKFKREIMNKMVLSLYIIIRTIIIKTKFKMIISQD